MSKRVTLTDLEIEQIIKGLEYLRKETSLNYPVIEMGRLFYSDLIAKLDPGEGTSNE